ncbi:MAG: DNA polymerase IV [Methanomicrobiales archaeon HGW-Methanomicrobiales-1]|nr:MAG: DNA polymerase IV [Methanomicrobiales archaeon HGW-Methanomicrobiales-1]
MDPRRIILHLDMDSFYASVEMQENPLLKGKPVVIGADPQHGTGRGVVSTCSYEARAFGVRSAMPISQAYVLCPQAIYLPPHFPRYAKASEAVMAILRSHNFPFQQVSIDEAFLDISPLRSFSTAADCAVRIKNEILVQLGLTCSIGIAPTKVVAKIASDVNKPDGLTLVKPETLYSFLAPMPVRKIPGVGSKSEAALFELGIRTIKDLVEYDTQELISRFGHSALSLQAITSSTDDDRVEERDGVKSVSRETTFSEDTSDEQVIVATIDALSQDVSRSLIDESLRCRTVTIKVRYTGFVTRTKARTLPHYTNDPKTIRLAAQLLLREMFDGRKIRLLGIRLSSFEKRDARQMILPV